MENRSFAQILREKTGATPSEKPVFSSSAGVDPAHLAYLMGTVSPLNSGFQHRRYQAPPPPPRKAHVLTESQKSAVEWFRTQGETLVEGFNSKELKTAFRRLALKMHPDSGGNVSPADFLTLMKHHQVLGSVFNK